MKQAYSSSLLGFLKRFAAASTIGLMLMNSAAGAQARIVFQDDNFSDDLSEGFRFNSDDAGDEDVTLQLGNDGSDGTIIWDDGLSELIIGDGTDGVSVNSGTWDISGAGVGSGFTGFTSTGTVNFSGSTQFRIREEAFGGVFTGGGAPACAADGELAVDTTPATENIYLCTDNATNTWTQVSQAAGNFLSAIASDTYGDAAGAQTLTVGDGTNADALTAAANSLIDFSNAAQFVMRTETSDPGTCTEGELYYNTTDNELRVCTATDTWGTAGPQDFEDVYAVDGDNTLTASGTFDVDATGALGLDSDAAVTVGGAGVGITSDGGILSLTGDGTADIDVSNTGAGIDFDSATFSLDATAGVSLDAADASNFTVATDAAGEDLTLSVTGATDSSVILDSSGTGADAIRLNASAGSIDIDAATDATLNTTSGDITIGAGDDVIFDDAQLTGTVQLSDTATDFDATFSSDGIIDNINSFTSTAAGEGASNVGFDNTNTANLSSTTVQGAIDETFTDLASTANGEGASLIGIEDAGGNFTGTTVEGALTELATAAGTENDVITLEPEYPNVIVDTDGTNNKGKLEADYEVQGANREQYYSWTTQQNSQNDIDLRIRYELPTDFDATGDLTLRINTATTTAADNSVAVTIRNDTDDTTCHADAATAAAAANTWETLTITAGEIDTGCTAGAALAAGDIIEIVLRLVVDNSNTGIIKVGTLEHSYGNSF